MTNEELHAIYSEIREKLFGVWDVTLVNDMYAFIFTAILKNRLKKRGKSDDQINATISGISDIESMKPVIEITRLALEKDNMTEEEFAAAKREYIRLYGDRNLEELKLESRTFRSNPELSTSKLKCPRKTGQPGCFPSAALPKRRTSTTSPTSAGTSLMPVFQSDGFSSVTEETNRSFDSGLRKRAWKSM